MARAANSAGEINLCPTKKQKNPLDSDRSDEEARIISALAKSRNEAKKSIVFGRKQFREMPDEGRTCNSLHMICKGMGFLRISSPPPLQFFLSHNSAGSSISCSPECSALFVRWPFDATSVSPTGVLSCVPI